MGWERRAMCHFVLLWYLKRKFMGRDKRRHEPPLDSDLMIEEKIHGTIPASPWAPFWTLIWILGHDFGEGWAWGRLRLTTWLDFGSWSQDTMNIGTRDGIIKKTQSGALHVPITQVICNHSSASWDICMCWEFRLIPLKQKGWIWDVYMYLQSGLSVTTALA